MKKVSKWIVAVLLAPVALFLLLSLLLYVPPIQDFVVRETTAYVAGATGMDISIERLRLSFPLLYLVFVLWQPRDHQPQP